MTAPPKRPLAAIRRAPRTLLRWWRRLTSMRTALVLLFLLAVASIPGSLLPQRPLNPEKVRRYIADNGAWGRLLDRLGAFDVFASPWYAAVYLLLFISLIGCIIPRVRVHLRAVFAKPLPAPRHLDRLPESASFTVDAPPADVAASIQGALGRRWRTIVRDEPEGRLAVAAEKGYTRETGNVFFHLALLAALVAIAAGRLFGYTGTVVVTEGSGFCNTVVSYDSFKPGQLVQDGQVAPFCIDKLNSFTATYRADGSPEQYAADVTYSEGVDGAPKHDVITVNHPLRIEGDRVYLINHGFSPTITVRTPDGTTRTTTAAFVPADRNLTSEGAFKLQSMLTDSSGERIDIGIEAVFAPDGLDIGDGVIASTSPQPTNPILGVIVYTGDLGLGKGLPQSVYSLDAAQKQNQDLVRVGAGNLKSGDVLTLPDGTTVTFDGFAEWASLQVSHDPAQLYLLIAASVMVAGLITSLTIRRRRVWVRLTPESSDGRPSRTVVAIGGLARSDSGHFPTEFVALVERLQQKAGGERT